MLKHASFVMAILLTLVSSRPLISYYTMSISTTDDIHYNTSLVIAVNAL